MSKPTKKRENYNTEILFAVKEATGYSIDYIRKCLRKDRTGQMPDEVIKLYNRMKKASDDAIAEKLNSINK